MDKQTVEERLRQVGREQGEHQLLLQGAMAAVQVELEELRRLATLYDELLQQLLRMEEAESEAARDE